MDEPWVRIVLGVAVFAIVVSPIAAVACLIRQIGWLIEFGKDDG